MRFANAIMLGFASVFKIGFFSNRFLLVGFLVELTLISLLIYVQPFQAILEHGPLPLPYWGFLFLYAPVMFLAEEGRKAVMRGIKARRAENRTDGLKLANQV
jgi:magnesium-transporting ATPase (P-type)